MQTAVATYNHTNPALFCGGAAVVDYYGIDNDDYVAGAGFCCEPQAQQKNARSLPTENVDYEKLQYYYHSDHLGSASYITNLDGEVVQHIEYVPFGEVFLEERNNTWNTPYLFNGKELDEETGLYYYGARYYNPRISLWYGVDPLAEKYPAHSPYCYTMNNPVMLIDPDGRKNVNFDEAGNYIDVTKDNWLHNLFVGNRGRILNNDGSVKQKFRFADPENDVADIEKGVINRIVFVKENEIISMLSSAGVFTSENKCKHKKNTERYDYVLEEGPAGNRMDFSYSEIPNKYTGASEDPMNIPSPMIFLVDDMAHNHMNFGNFLFGAGGKSLGLTLPELKVGAHYRALTQRGEDGYRPQFDSKDDQLSISKGVRHARQHKYKNMEYGVEIGPLSPPIIIP